MKVSLITRLAAASAFAILMSGSAAQAVTVMYTTTGTFASSGTNIATSSDSKLTFNGGVFATNETNNDSFPAGNPLPAVFGTFTLNTTDAIKDGFNTTFSLNITQAIPVVIPGNPGTLTATVQGNVSVAPGTGVLVVSFGTNPIQIGTIGYFLNDVSVKIPNGYIPGTDTAPFEVTGTLDVPGNTPDVVPLPGAVTAGTVLLGSLGAVKRLKRRTVSA